jgi:acyl-CoA dehydrogenase
MELDEQTLMIRDTVRKFVERELMPLEQHVMRNQVALDDGGALTAEQYAHLRHVSRDLGLWGLDAPEAFGGYGLSQVTMAVVAEEMGRTITHFILPPDTPNLLMLAAVGSDEQKARYLQPYIDGELVS